MAPRSSGSTTIAFGLISIPVKLYATYVAGEYVRFSNRGPDGELLKQLYVVVDKDGDMILKDGAPQIVKRDDMIKEFKLSKDEKVIFTQAEVASLKEQVNDVATIKAFIPLDTVPLTLTEKTWHLMPGKGGHGAYELLRRALVAKNAGGLVEIVMREKLQPAIVRPDGEGLMMQRLNFADRSRTFDDLGYDPMVPTDEMQVLANQLVDSMMKPAFDPQMIVDPFKVRVHAAAEQKLAGKDIVLPVAPKPDIEPGDLMAALQASMKMGTA